MVKGHSYDLQLYYSIADRLINNHFLNKMDGIFADEGNSCKVTYSSNAVTISDGFLIVQGGITEVVSTETLAVNLNDSYCRLIYEIDMSKVNTDTEFNQGIFKILTGTSSYPALTKQKLTENSGIYQYELAQFRAKTTGISDFVDKRTFLDYDSIYKFIKDEIDNIEDGSIYVTKNEIKDLQTAVDNLSNQPEIIVQATKPEPVPGKTIVWIYPKEG